MHLLIVLLEQGEVLRVYLVHVVHYVEESIREILDEQDAKKGLGISNGGTLHGLHVVEAIHRIVLH